MSLEQLAEVRSRMMPMIRTVARDYEGRLGPGYPNVVDSVATGTLGLEVGPDYALYIVSEGDHLVADFYVRSSRTDARSSAMREKFAGVPFHDPRPLAPHPDDITLRNLLAELMAHYNTQPGLIYISDS